jgi:plastocyanin
MHFLRAFLLLALLFCPGIAFAEASVVEGDEAMKLYQAEKSKAQVLVQKGKEFVWRSPDGKEIIKPESVNVKVGQRFYITNEEHEIIHNVYDTTDASWVLKKQEPSKVAAITFLKPGEHYLRCAIHPLMKITVKIAP